MLTEEKRIENHDRVGVYELSWTLSLEKARWFANRFSSSGHRVISFFLMCFVREYDILRL